MPADAPSGWQNMKKSPSLLFDILSEADEQRRSDKMRRVSTDGNPCLELTAQGGAADSGTCEPDGQQAAAPAGCTSAPGMAIENGRCGSSSKQSAQQAGGAGAIEGDAASTKRAASTHARPPPHPGLAAAQQLAAAAPAAAPPGPASLLQLTPSEVLHELLGDLYVDWAWLEMGEQLGEGGFAAVRRAILTRSAHLGPTALQEPVAVKQLRPDALTGPEDLKEFLTEANLLRKLRHGHIVSLLGVGASDTADLVAMRESMFLVQELMDGGDLKQLVLQQMGDPFAVAYSKADALRWGMQVAEAMHYLHAVCKPMIIHRDLKLDNVLLTGGPMHERNAKVADFGLHKRVRRAVANNLLVPWDSDKTYHGQDYEKSYYGGNMFASATADGGSSRGGGGAAGKRAPPAGVSVTASAFGAIGQDLATSLLLADAAVLNDASAACQQEPSVHRKVSAVRALDRSVRAGRAFHQQGDGSGGGEIQPQGEAGSAADGSTATATNSTEQQQQRQQPGSGLGGNCRRAGLDPQLVQQIQQGLAQPGSSARFIEATQRVGSLLYMAPEVLAGSAYNEKVDVFSFGVVLYELMAGHVAASRTLLCQEGAHASAAKMLEYAQQVALGHREDIPAYWPATLRRLVADCWHQDPAARPAFGDVLKRLYALKVSGAIEQLDMLKPAGSYNPAADCGCGSCSVM